MAAGLGFKDFVTGEVLTAADVDGYLMQGIWVFDDAAARDAAVTSPQEGNCCYLKDTDAVQTYSGTAWVGFDDSNAIQNSIVDAKGDIVAASGNDTPARLAVGNDGETLVADSSTSTGLRYQATNAAGKNAIINGGFDIAQRGTSFTVASIAYTVDRWQIWSTGAGGNCVVTRVAGTAGAQYATEFGRQVSSSSLTQPQFAQTIETANATQYAGKNVVISFEALKGANYSGGDLTVNVITGTGTDQNFTAFTGAATVSNTFTLTASNAAYTTGAVAIPAGTTEMALVFTYTATGTAGAADYVRLQKVQLEIGSVATAFTRAGGTIQGELAACQRYYYRTTAEAVYSVFGYGGSVSTTIAAISIPFPVTLRTTPTSLDASAIAVQEDFAGGIIAATLTLAGPSKWAGNLDATVASGLTKYRPERILANNNAAAFVGFNAEL
jgi:hypothetical protein